MAIGEDGRGIGREGVPQPGQGMLQAVARLTIAPIAPEEARKLVPRLGRPRGEREDGKQRTVLLTGDVNDGALREPRHEMSEEGQLDGRHNPVPGEPTP